MGTECQKDFSDEDDALLDEAEMRVESVQGVCEQALAEYAKLEPAIHEAMQVRSLEILGENFDNLRERTEKQLAGSGDHPTDLQQIAKDTWPTQTQLHEMVVAAEKVGMDEDEVISAPLICATPGVNGVEELVYDMLWAIEHQDLIPYTHKDDHVFSKVVYADSQSTGPTGAPSQAKFDPVTKTLFIFRKLDGDFPAKEYLRDVILPHEIAHASEKFREKLGGRTEELDFVMRDEQERAQNEGKQNISPYIERLQVLYESGEIDDTTMESEWISECVRLYAKGECLETTRDFVKTLFAD